MNACVIYFSQTGNTEKVARQIVAGLRSQNASVDFVTWKEAKTADLARYDLIGIGTPVFYYREPVVIQRLLGSMPKLTGKFGFLFITHGGNPVNTFLRMQKALAKKDVAVIGAFECFGFDTYPAYIGTDRQIGHPDEKELARAEAFGRELLLRYESALGESRNVIPKFKKEHGKYNRLSILLSGPALKWISPKKNLDRTRCTRCGECLRRCPTDAIEMNPYPVFNDRCIYCYLCERICPEKAIVCDWSKIKKWLGVT